MNLVLASASPRRRQLLQAANVLFEVRPADVDETPRAGEAPATYAARVAADKARALAIESPVLAADTVVTLDGRILGKPVDDADARITLKALSGREHEVLTAVVFVFEGRSDELVVSTAVRFRALTSVEIDRYVGTGEPMDKAGAYGIQGGGGALVAEVRGSYTNIVGLPLEETLALLEKRGCR